MSAAPGATRDWESLAKGMRVVRLTLPLRLLVPGLAFPTLSKATRGLTLYPGRPGQALGALLVGSSAVIGYLLIPSLGIAGPLISAWLLGTVGVTMFAAALRPTAFVKPICVSCRLLPVITEHEALHLSGVSDEDAVWASMKTRHSVASLSLEGDPAICPFCPIPKRLSER